MTKLISEIDTQPADAESKTLDALGFPEMRRAHEATVTSERQRIETRQASGIAETKAALDESLAGVRQREAERERLLTGPLGK